MDRQEIDALRQQVVDVKSEGKDRLALPLHTLMDLIDTATIAAGAKTVQPSAARHEIAGRNRIRGWRA